METTGDYTFKSQILNDFYQSHKRLFWQYHEVVSAVLLVLDREGEISSLDYEAPFWWRTKNKAAYEQLSQVSLLQHAVDVAEIIVELIDKKSLFVLLGIIAALAHDLGKIKSIKNPALTEIKKRVHAYSSAEYITPMLNQILTANEAAAVIEAIRLHHEPALGGPLVYLLKRADALARERENIPLHFRPTTYNVFERPRELKLSLEDYRYHQESLGVTSARIPDPGTMNIPWFDFDEFIIRLTPFINCPKNRGLKAFSTKGGIYYFEPYFLFEILKTIALEKQRDEFLDIEANQQRRNDAIAFIINKFRQRDLVCEALLPSSQFFFWRYYVYYSGFPTESHYLVPIRMEGFTIGHERLEKKKLGKLKWIYLVKPAMKGKNDAKINR